MITGHTRLAAVMAQPIKHSISPLIHNTGFKANKLDNVYLAFEVDQQGLPQAIESIRTLNLLGVNLSMPNKQLAYELVDETTPAADLVGSINTIVNQDGHLVGHNTDGVGFMASLKEAKVETIGETITVLGSGGAGLAIVAQAALDGVGRINLFNRKGPNYSLTKKKVQEITEKTGCLITLLPLEEKTLLKNAIAHSRLLVNTTSVGMSPNEEGCLIPDSHFFHPKLVVADIIYQPQETQLLKMATKVGCQTINGLGMLVHQGAKAFELWTDEKLPIELVKVAIKKKIK